MARVPVVVESRSYVANLDDPRRRGDLYQSIVMALLVDELTGAPVAGPIRVGADLDGLTPEAANGIAGLAGVPSRLFPVLDAQPYAFRCHLGVDGFVPLDLTVIVPQQPTFPDQFTDVDLGVLALRRLPVALTVRSLVLDAQDRPVPLPGATVQVSAVWRRIDELSNPAVAVGLVALRPAVSVARPALTTTLEPVVLTAAVEPLRRLEREVGPGDRTLAISRRGGLTAASLVAIDRGDSDRSEVVQAADVLGPSDPSSPATVVLAFPVQHRHIRDVPVESVTAAAGPAPADLTEAAVPGDTTVFVTSTAPFAGTPLVRISHGTGPDEYAVAARYRVVTDPEGYGRLPPLTRVAAAEVVANAPGPLAAGPLPWTPRYGVVDQHLHLTLT